MLDPQKLIMLRAVAMEGSIAAAARELGYTRSAVSQQVSGLERAVGAALLVRDGHGVLLTPAGRRLVEHTERILIELRAAESAVQRDAESVTGLLRIGVPFREGPAIMSSALTQVRQRYPRLEIRLAAITDDTGADEVRRGRLDMVILSRFGSPAPDDRPGLREWVLGHDALRLCVPVGHRLAGAATCTLAELHDESWILSPASALGRLTATLCVAAGFEPAVVATVGDLATALGLVAIGWGLTIAPELTPAGSDREVVRIPLTGVDIVRHRILIVRDGEHLSPRLAGVISAVHRANGAVYAADGRAAPSSS